MVEKKSVPNCSFENTFFITITKISRYKNTFQKGQTFLKLEIFLRNQVLFIVLTFIAITIAIAEIPFDKSSWFNAIKNYYNIF